MSMLGTVYLIHFDRPFKHAKHYTGWALNLEARIAEHRGGFGARLLAVIKAAGIGWQVARTWENVDRHFERRLKVQGGASRRCPMCGIVPSKPRERKTSWPPPTSTRSCPTRS